MPLPFFFLDFENKTHCIGRGKIFTVINRRGGVQVDSSPRVLDIGGLIPVRDRKKVKATPLPNSRQHV